MRGGSVAKVFLDMCLFPIPNENTEGIAYQKGVHFFDCGACPECLRKRSSVWVLRSVFEARAHAYNCMVTLTYDNFVRNDKGEIIGETPVNPNLKVNQRDVQLFIKRLRKWYSGISSEKVKYIACAEYGSHTHRAHYHLLLFGVRFPDAHYYKKSKRGNPIYMSNILTKLWCHGICTIDANNVHSAVAMYCTKYCAKSRSLDTFMLYSQCIGVDYLMRDFNGINYMIDGREYTVPRFVWQRYICSKYKDSDILFSPKYVNKTDKTLADGSFEFYSDLRRGYRWIRDNDPVYVNYLSYWQRRGEMFDAHKPPVRERILALDENKLHAYKVKALACYDRKRDFGRFEVAPGSRAGVSRVLRRLDEHGRSVGRLVDYHAYLPLDVCDRVDRNRLRSHLPVGSRPITASDTTQYNKVSESHCSVTYMPVNFHFKP